MNPAAERAVPAKRSTTGTRTRFSRRRGVAGVVAALAVVGFAGVILAPTGVALADPPVAEETQSLFAVAAQDTQNLTVDQGGATIAPVDRGAFDVYVTPTPTPTPVVAAASGSDSSGSSSDSTTALFYTGSGSASEWMAAAGIAASDWAYVDYVVSQESGWNPNAVNSSSGACGLVQALPCSKVPGNGYDPVDNLRWATSYATGRYGSWAGAYAFWISNHWW